MRRIIAAGLAIALPLAAAAAETTTAYDLLFRNGTLDALDRTACSSTTAPYPMR